MCETGMHQYIIGADDFAELISKEDASLSRLMQQIGLKKSPAPQQ
jgi:hypothetical protein